MSDPLADLARVVSRIMEEKHLSSSDVEFQSRGRITKTTVNRIKAGAVNPSLETLLALCDGLRVAPEVIWAAALGKDLASASEKERVLFLFEALPPAWRDLALRMLEAMWEWSQGSGEALKLKPVKPPLESNVEVIEWEEPPKSKKQNHE